MTDVAVVVPFRAECSHRQRAWEWIQQRYAERYPDWLVVEASASDGPWCKAAAINPAVEATDAEIVVQADADVWSDGLAEAVTAVEAGAPWAVPHLDVCRLSEEATNAVLAGGNWRDAFSAKGGAAQRPYHGFLGGGIVVARREVMVSAPIDVRFTGWG